MVPLTSLILPIVLSAVTVFILSAIVHMALGYHADDFGPVPDEPALRNALRNIPPGDYGVPYAGSMEVMKTEEYARKVQEGPIAFLLVQKGRPMSMGRELGLWFVFCLIVSLFAAYIASRALAPGATYLEAFRFAGTTAFAGYVLSNWQNVVWYRRSAKTELKNTFDGLLYALVTGGIFGWLWP